MAADQREQAPKDDDAVKTWLEEGGLKELLQPVEMSEKDEDIIAKLEQRATAGLLTGEFKKEDFELMIPLGHDAN